MNKQQTLASRPATPILLVAGIILIAINLRPAITSVGPLIGTIRDSIGLENWSAGLITSLPLLAFAVMSPLAPRLSNKIGGSLTLLSGLIILMLGILVRSAAYIPTLYLGTTLVGLGIAICNVLLPGLIKEKFPEKVGFMTSVYSTSMATFAALASGLSIPLAADLQLGWQASLASWALLTGLAIIIWSFYIHSQRKSLTSQQFYEPSAAKLIKSTLAWQVTLFMGMQSFLFYVTISWLPEILHDYGLAIGTAGWLLSYMQFISLPATFVAPILADKFKNQQGMVAVIGFLALTGYSGLLAGGPMPLLVVWITLIGLSLGASISLALTFLSMRTVNARQAAELSGMAQSIGYLFAAIGPFSIGFFYDLTQIWQIPLLIMIFISLLIIIFGLGAGRNKYV
ncbi:CynX/NimT family MFS transporter [Sediminibacillus albus]|uniref:MFS transporter, CP family, cyanate transporter n=1 Tax=Sediminibacillus albus TaxID=407036 RepID=A0A1G9ANZ1_9BACI|nr:MFS transporter [Sediminibacillus albus]SDK29079.1 MFS transporter, CP family, cyanate transporter [Sediminibacillus albus]